MTRTRPVLAYATIIYALAFNIPFANLARIFEYPDVLRRPAGEVMTLFASGGTELILTWHAFAIAALLLVPFAMALSLSRQRLTTHPTLAVGAAIAGSLAGLAQAMGLWRWVFVVPELTRTYLDPLATETSRSAAEQTFTVLNLYGGVAIGEHLGQLLTALFVLLLSLVQRSERSRITAILGLVTAAAITVGTTEGLAIALGQPGDVFSLATIAGFLGLTVWLIATGLTHLRPTERLTLAPGYSA
jgi:hypothetical protein